MRVKINNRSWTIRSATAREMRDRMGDCDHPPGRHPTIRVRRSLGTLATLDTVVHEVLHASRPELAEDAVDETASTIARILHRLGARVTLPP